MADTVEYECPTKGCLRTYDSPTAARQCRDSHDNQPEPLPDGGRVEAPRESEVELDGKPQARVVFWVQGVEFRSDPMDWQRAQQLSNGLGQATVPIDLGERPLCDDERARLEPVEVDDE